MICLIIVPITTIILIIGIWKYIQLRKLITRLEKDLSILHTITHSQINTIYATASLVDMTWGSKSKYQASSKEQKIIDCILNDAKN